MITDGEKWHYLPVKKLSALFRGIASKHAGNFYCLNFFHSYSTKNKLKKHIKVCKNHYYFCVEMPEEDNKILKYNHGEKSMKVPYIIYADLESLLEKMITSYNDPKKSSTAKINKHTAFSYSLFTHCSFDATKNEIDYYRVKNCMKNFSLDLREHATKIINNEKKEMIPLTKEENKMHRTEKICYICKKRFCTNDSNKEYFKAKVLSFYRKIQRCCS